MQRTYSKLVSIIVVLLLLTSTQFITIPPAASISEVNMTLNVNKNSFYIREVVQIDGSVTYGPLPLQGGLVAIQVKAPSGQLAFRTLDTGNLTNNDWPITVGIESFDSDKNPTTNFTVSRPLPSIPDFAFFNVTITNNRTYTQTVYVALTIFDADNFALEGAMCKGPHTLSIGETRTLSFQQWLPNYASPGEALACVSIYTLSPAYGGFAVMPETQLRFNILSYYGMPINKKANPDLTTPVGSFNTTIGLSPDCLTSEYGNYSIFANVNHLGYTAYQRADFIINYAPTPPQAQFFTKPIATYVNTTITFNATTTSAEGFNDTGITSYKWNFGDGTSTGLLTTFTTTHLYNETGTYIVTLNVTDSENLWCVVKKPVIIIPPSPPIADFTWSPTKPVINQPATFNASTSLPGYNGTQNIPIVSYEWNFGDGNITTVTSTTIIHKYTTVSNYTVALTVTDAHDLSNSTSKIVQVTNQTLIGDVNGDGKVDGKDIAIVARAYNTQPGDLKWDSRADINGDLKVDGKDIAIVAKHYGEKLSSFSGTYTSGFQISTVTRSVLYVPQAFITYVPRKVYGNVTTTFDASYSSAEGLNDTFVNYKWNFGDGTSPQQAPTPTTTHSFVHAGKVVVTLNVTDTEGLWCALLQPLTVRPSDPPVAAFTWAPTNPAVNEITTFDASSSLPGYNGTQDIPIVSYKWNFGDGNITTVTSMTIRHEYTAEANYTVTLTVTDAHGLQGSKTQTVTVQNEPPKPGDVNGDGEVDGKDIAIVAKAYNTQPGDTEWDARADLNGDLKVDGKDVAIVSKYYGT